MELTHSYRLAQKPLSNDSSSDGECSNSDNEESSWKRSKKPANKVVTSMDVDSHSTPAEIASEPLPPRKRKVNNVWSAVLQEQSLSEDLGRFGVRRKPISLQERSCESYDFTRKALDPRFSNDDNIFSEENTMDRISDESIFCDEESPDESTKETEKSTQPSTNGKMEITKEVINLRNNKKRKKFTIKEEEEIRKATKYIIKTLNEPKHSLISRIVRTIGAKDALELLKRTEDVEEAGGMMVFNQSRRRTPGGVYIQLLKNFPKVSKEQIDEIFAEEKKLFEMRRKSFKKSKKKLQRKKAAQDKEKMEFGEPSVNASNTSIDESLSAAVIKDTEQLEEVICDTNERVTENKDDKEQIEEEDDEIEEGEIDE